jgi:hypothetical protein
VGLNRHSKRLRRLEERASASTGSRSPRYLEAYFRALESLKREEAGLPPLPYSEVDRREDEEFLRETLPSLRASLGWQTVDAQHALDIWERDTIERLQKGA